MEMTNALQQLEKEERELLELGEQVERDYEGNCMIYGRPISNVEMFACREYLRHLKGINTMAKLSELLPSTGNYLKAAEIPDGTSLKLVIEKITQEKMPARDAEGGEEIKPVVYFVGKDKGLVLNRTNLDTLISLFGDDVQAIIGKEVILFRTFASFGGNSVAALRLRGIDEPNEPDDIPF